MAPRGRPRKRLSRMDAALDAMKPFGFDESLVRTTVNKLLKEYEGDEGWEGWAFIEDCGYKELIDAILRDQEADHDEERQTQTQKGVSSQDERAEDPASESIIAPSGALVVSTCNEAGNTVGETACTELVNAVEEPTYEELCCNKQDIGSTEVFYPPSAERDGNRWTDIGEDQILTQKGSANALFSNGENPRSTSHVTSPPPTTSACPVNRLKRSSWRQVQSQSTSHVSTPPPSSSSTPVVNHFKMSFGSQVKSQNTPRVSTPPPTSSSCPVSRLKMNSGSQVQSRSTSRVSTPPQSSSSTPVVNHFKMSFGSQVKSQSTPRVSTLPPTSSSCPVSRLKMNSGSQVQSRSTSHVSTPPPTSSSSSINRLNMISVSQVKSGSPISSLPPLADHRTTTLPSSKPVSVPPRKRVPCYGWIGSDDEEDADDFIQLPPMKPTTPLQSQNSSGGTNKQMKRKSRWDISPNDP